MRNIHHKIWGEVWNSFLAEMGSVLFDSTTAKVRRFGFGGSEVRRRADLKAPHKSSSVWYNLRILGLDSWKHEK